jgi:scyllo-inositol 2-dehydrogenase (NADP+)
MQTVNVGLVGYGLAGSVFHAPLIRSVEGLRLTHVATSVAAKVHGDLPDVEVVETPQALFRTPEVDLVVIATPNLMHFPLAKEALLAGKHVVVDKPFVIRASEGEELARLAVERGRVLSVFHNRRWDNDFLTVREVIASGLLGAVHSYEAHFDRYRPDVRDRWREQNLPGSGLLYDLGSHLIDQALCLFGRPSTVRGETAVQRPEGKSVDWFRVTLEHKSVRSVLRAGSLVRSPGPRYQVHGTTGSFLKHGIDSQEEALRQGRRPGDPGWGRDSEAGYGEIVFDRDGLSVTGRVETLTGCYEAYYRDMRRAITDASEPPVTAAQAIDVIRVMELACESSLRGAAVAFE